ncbi:MAG: hypothetical protein HEQ38_04045 [Gemmatimonas sp.]|nr:hypothetical protein [Gemmatimonas sp.]
MFFRRVVYWVSGRCLHWFYREHRVVGYGKVPTSGPVLLIGNHPNDLPDVISGLYLSPRHPRYLATVSVTTSVMARAMYESMAVIPVARVRDARKMKAEGVDLAAVNQAANDTVSAALASGEVVAVFPEGGTHDVPQIGRLRTGVAKMILGHLDAGAKNDVTIVPFGAQYEAPRRWGSDTMTVLGEPWSARGWYEAQPAEHRGLAALTDRLRESLLSVTRNAASWEEGDTRDEIVAAAAAATAPHDPLDASPTMVSHAAAVAANAYSGGMWPQTVRLKTATHALARAVERAGGIGTSAVDHALLLYALEMQAAKAPVSTAVLLAGVPAAAIGWLVHAPILAVVYAVAKRTAKDRVDFVPNCFVPGLYMVLLWWVLVSVLAAAGGAGMGIGPWWALPLLVASPRLGDLAIEWRQRHAGWRLVRRVRRWSTSDRMALREAATVVRETATQWTALP